MISFRPVEVSKARPSVAATRGAPLPRLQPPELHTLLVDASYDVMFLFECLELPLLSETTGSLLFSVKVF